MIKRAFAVFSVVLLALGMLTGCGSESKDDHTIKVAATTVPHAEILEAVKPILEKQGYTLEIREFDDYVQPNMVVESGEFDANFFQHSPYMENFNQEQGGHLVNAGNIHYEPFGLYAGTQKDLSRISDGATIAVPNDTSNEARALLLLQENGLITLKEDAGITATVQDIVQNPHNIQFVELVSAQIPRTLPEVSFGVLNGNYAVQAGLKADVDALVCENADSEIVRTYVNIVAVKEGNQELPKIRALVEALKSEETRRFINEKYQGNVVLLEE